MSEDRVLSGLRAFVVREFLFGDDDGLTPDTNLLRLGVIDSMSLMTLTTWVGDEFSAKLNPEDLKAENFATLTAMAALVRARMS